MQIQRQLGRKTIRLVKYIMIYLLAALIIISLFSFVYLKLGVPSPFVVSTNIFFGLENNIYVPRAIHLSQLTAQNILFVTWISTSLASLLKPLNPLFFSKYIVYIHGKYKFRYWIMLPEGHFLYNVHIRIFLSNGALFNGGANKIEGIWQLNSDIQDIDLARGVRYVVLSKSDSQRINSEIKKLKDPEKASVYFTIMIQGSNENGMTFFAQKRYPLAYLKNDYDFVSIRQPEYLAAAKKMGYKTSVSEDPTLIRYHNFDKIYKASPSSGKTPRVSSADKKDIFIPKQMVEGQYPHTIRQSLLDFIDYMITFFLDGSVVKRFGQHADKGRK